MKWHVFKKGQDKQNIAASTGQPYLSRLNRIYSITLITICGLAIILVLAFYQKTTQIDLRQYYQQPQFIPVPRGLILDDTGRLLAENKPMYWYQGGWHNYQEVLSLSEDKLKNEDIFKLPVKYVRYYPYSRLLAHVVGYVQPVAPADLNKYTCSPKQARYCLINQSYIGVSGLEAYYETKLQGIPGVRRQKRIIRQPQPGQDINLSINLKLQRFIDGLLVKTDKPAAVIVAKTDGSIKALLSYPSFDSNIFSGVQIIDSQRRQEMVNQLLTDPNHPLINRAYQQVYPPGSVFKIVVAMAGLEEGKITRNTKIEDTGFIQIGKYIYRNWYWSQYGKTEGKIDVIKAIARSNDVFFYRLGEKLGPDKIAEYAEKFGFGNKTGIDLIGEETGQIPSPYWKQQVKNEAWFLGNTYHMAIGQGDVLATPLQVAQMTLAVANDGLMPRLHLTKTNQTKEIKLKFQPNNWQIVKQGMKQACQPGGTAFVFFDYSIEVGCKTGTAEVVNKTPHAWFTLFAPFDKPEYVITVMLESAGEGSYKAAPIAKQILDFLLANEGGV